MEPELATEARLLPILDQLRDRLFADHPTFGQIGLAPGSMGASLDLSGLGAGRMDEVIDDWRQLRTRMKLGEDPA